MKVDAIIDFMESTFPSCEALDFDNVGLLVGRRGSDVKKVITALDCTYAVVKEAVEKGADMVVCHHPILFSGVKRITDETEEGQMILAAAENKIAIFAAHTNLDFAKNGLNDFFLKKLGFEAKGTIVENEGRIFDSASITAGELCGRVKKAFDLKYIRTSMDENKILISGALCTGGGKSLVEELSGKADFYISGDLGHHDILSLSEMGIGFIEISHYDSEKIAAELLKERLDEKFNGEIEVCISEKGVNPMRVI